MGCLRRKSLKLFLNLIKDDFLSPQRWPNHLISFGKMFVKMSVECLKRSPDFTKVPFVFPEMFCGNKEKEMRFLAFLFLVSVRVYFHERRARWRIARIYFCAFLLNPACPLAVKFTHHPLGEPREDRQTGDKMGAPEKNDSVTNNLRRFLPTDDKKHRN